jgi:AcrR family transcriptional regulator
MTERKSPSAKKRNAAKPGPRDDRGVISDRILTIARRSFAEQGYAGTSLRQVARDADVDPALVTYYYKTKAGLLDAALVPPDAWTRSIATAANAPLKQRGAALVHNLLEAWDDPAIAEFLRGTILTAAHEQIALQRLAANFAVHILNAVSSKLDGHERMMRASLISTQMVGLAIVRYVWRVGAIATVANDDVVALIAPTVQRYLNGRLST